MADWQLIFLEHDGTRLLGKFAWPLGNGPFPAVMIMHSGIGIGDHVHLVAGRLLAMGYAVLISDMFGEGRHGDLAAAGEAFGEMHANPAVIRSRAGLWHKELTGLAFVDPAQTAAIGYCFGGQCVLELARSGADARAFVSFHGILTTRIPAQPGSIRGEVLAWCGGRDAYAPRDHVDVLRTEMQAAGASLQLTIFEHAEHGFTDHDAAGLGRAGISYDSLADAASWAGTVAVLDRLLRPGKASR